MKTGIYRAEQLLRGDVTTELGTVVACEGNGFTYVKVTTTDGGVHKIERIALIDVIAHDARIEERAAARETEALV